MRTPRSRNPRWQKIPPPHRKSSRKKTRVRGPKTHRQCRHPLARSRLQKGWLRCRPPPSRRSLLPRLGIRLLPLRPQSRRTPQTTQSHRFQWRNLPRHARRQILFSHPRYRRPPRLRRNRCQCRWRNRSRRRRQNALPRRRPPSPLHQPLTPSRRPC